MFANTFWHKMHFISVFPFSCIVKWRIHELWICDFRGNKMRELIFVWPKAWLTISADFQIIINAHSYDCSQISVFQLFLYFTFASSFSFSVLLLAIYLAMWEIEDNEKCESCSIINPLPQKSYFLHLTLSINNAWYSLSFTVTFPF